MSPKILKDLGMIYPTSKSKKKKRYFLVECPTCFKSYRRYAMSKSKMCGSCANRITSTTHNLSKTRLHSIWEAIKQRCYNKNNKHYKNYGGRGIKLCYKWANSYIKFRGWALNNGYNSGLTIDRKNNDGNYEPDNCRWVDRYIQNSNTRILRSNNTSGYRGVYYNKSRKKFIARINVKKITTILGAFDDAIGGAIAYNNYVKANNLPHPLNVLPEQDMDSILRYV